MLKFNARYSFLPFWWCFIAPLSKKKVSLSLTALHSNPSEQIKETKDMIIDAKTQKYDRQLRLWKAHGQAALESAHICLVNGNATGAEILKNLVLPGNVTFVIFLRSLNLF